MSVRGIVAEELGVDRQPIDEVAEADERPQVVAQQLDAEEAERDHRQDGRDDDHAHEEQPGQHRERGEAAFAEAIESRAQDLGFLLRSRAARSMRHAGAGCAATSTLLARRGCGRGHGSRVTVTRRESTADGTTRSAGCGARALVQPALASGRRTVWPVAAERVAASTISTALRPSSPDTAIGVPSAMAFVRSWTWRANAWRMYADG